MRKKALLYGFLISLLGLTACQRNSWKKEVKGMKAYDKQAFWYKLMTNNRNKTKPEVGEQVRIDYTLQKDAEVLDQSYQRTNPILVQIPPDKYDNFFTQALKLMGEGDSLVIKLPASAAGDMLGQYEEAFEEDELVTFTYKMYWIKSAETLDKEVEKETKRIDSIRTKMISVVTEYQQPAYKKSLERTSSGLRYRILEKGAGKPIEKGDLVSVHYMCFLTNGKEVQNSFELMKPMELNVGSAKILDGWNEGLQLLNRGGKAILFIPHYLAYGSKGVEGLIPPNSTLIFYIDVV